MNSAVAALSARSLNEGVSTSQVRGQRVENVLALAGSITNLGTAALRPIPLAAVPFRGTLADPDAVTRTTRRPREIGQIGVDADPAPLVDHLLRQLAECRAGVDARASMAE